MGTRSLTVVKDTEKSKDIIVMYRQFDGYPTGHGAELKEFLADFTVVNGISSNTPERAANGMGCLAAQLVAHFKVGQPDIHNGSPIGNIYLEPSGSRDLREEYVYTVYMSKGKNSKLSLKVQCGSVTFFGLPGTKERNMPVLFQGPVEEFDPASAGEVQRKLHDEIPNDYVESKG